MAIRDDYKNIQLVYFSGTGGTARVVQSFKDLLEKRNINVMIEALNSVEHLGNVSLKNVVNHLVDLLIILYPVHAFDAPEPIYSYIRRLPNFGDIPSVVISVSGGGEVWVNNGCRIGPIKKLESKGYPIIYEKMLVMPSNFVVATGEELAIPLLKILPSKVEHCIVEILAGVKCRRRPEIKSRIMTFMLKIEKPCAKFFGKSLRIRGDCTSCGWCVRNCPRGNIQMKDHKPSFGWKCIICLRCIYGCPQHSIYTRLFSFITLKGGFDISKFERDIPEVDLKTLKENKMNLLLFKGVIDYLNDHETL